MRLLSWLILGLMALPAPAAAADWWWLGTFGETPTRMNAYAEYETSRNDGKRTVQLFIFTHLETTDESGERSARALVTVDCIDQSWSGVNRISYDSAGAVIGTAELDGRPNRNAPGTMGHSLVRVACGSAPPIEQGISEPLAHSLEAMGRGAQSAGVRGSDSAQTAIASGTGFFIGGAGYVLTSYHVVEGAQRIACRTTSGQIHEASFVRGSPANDLALLRVDSRPTAYLGFAPPGSARPGDRVFTVGFPVIDLLGVEPRFTDGTVSALSVAGESAFLQTSIPIQPGNSGGPVVTESGQVVAVVAATAAIEPFFRNTGALPQNVNWAVKAEYASPLLDPMPPAPRRTREEAIALVRSSVCLIVAER